MNAIRRMREKARITQAETAKRLGVTQASVAQWEIGEVNPRSDKLPQLAAILGCKIDDLFDLGRG